MSGYIGKIKVDNNDPVIIGSTLYGTCSTAAGTAAKSVTLSDFNTPPLPGLTIHIKFTNGNNVTSGVTLAIGNQTAVNVSGNCVCAAGDIIAFTYEEPNASTKTWIANHSIVVEEGTTNGQIKIAGQAVSVHGLNDAAYKNVLTSDIAGNSSSTAVPTVAAVTAYVTAATGGLSGLSGAMHFRGITATEPSGTTVPSDISIYDSSNPEAGDVIVYGRTVDNTTVYSEYVWVNNTVGWELLGDQGSYAYDNAVIHNSLLTTTGDIIYASGANTPARLAIGTGNNKFLKASSGVPVWGVVEKTDVGLENVDNIKQIPFSTATTAGDLIYYNGSTYTRLGLGTEGQVLTAGSSSAPIWSTSSVDWSNVANKITATTNTLGLVKTTSTVSSATGYTASPIIDGVVYYQDTHYTSSGSINALTSINLTYNDGTAQTNAVSNSSSTPTALGTVALGVLYIKSMYYGTDSASTGVSVDNT